MQLPFGKKVQCGNFYVIKRTRTLSKKEISALRKAEHIPDEVQKQLERGGLSYITISTVSDSWRVEFVAGMTKYAAIDEIPVASDAEGNYTYYGDYLKALLYNIIGMYAYTSTAGDAEYQKEVLEALQRYLDRESKKNSKPLSDKENKELMEESEKKERTRNVIIKMSDYIKNEENGKQHD